MKTTFDYIVVGGGSAGCVMATRLSEDPDAEVLLVEAGDRDRNLYIHIPAGFAKMTTGPLTWGLETVPQKHANDRVIPMAQGKVLGGGSSINAQVFTRGHPIDYDRWANDEGCPGWSFSEIQKYFLRAEGNSILSGEWHGRDGPLSVSNLPSPHPLTRRFVQACQELGMPYNPDFNRADQAGTSVYQTTSRNGRRCSTAQGYLKPVLSRPNLTLKTKAQVQRLIVENGRVAGIQLEDGDYRASQEILLCSGGLGSAKLLMLSGIGPADHLQSVGVDVVHDLPGVGEALQDHFVIDIICKLKNTTTLNRYDNPFWMAWAGLQWAVFGHGPATSNVAEGGAFWRSSKATEEPDLQFHFLPGVGAEDGVESLPSGVGATLNAYFVRPQSRGTMRLRSSNPADKPLLDPNYLAEPEDVAGSIEAVETSRDIMRQAAFTDVMEAEIAPGAAATSRADLETYVRQNGRTGYHPVGTCRMGSDDMAVVDPQLRLRGLDGIRVCDSSVMPSIVGSNTNAPTVMIAERAADLVRGNRTTH